MSMALLPRCIHRFRSLRSRTRFSPAPICYNVNGRIKKEMLLRSMMHWVVAFYDAFRQNHSIVLLYCSWSLKPTSRASSSMTTCIRRIFIASWHRFRSLRSGTRSGPAPIYNVNGRIKTDMLLRSMMHWVVSCVAFYDAFR